MTDNPVISAIRNRRSFRKFTGQPLSDEIIKTILEAGRWAPSGLNNQPWRFAVIKDPGIKEKIARCTHYGRIIKSASVCIAVFYDSASGYNRDKDIQAIGACIQNMLLAIHSLGLGAVWLGEILNRKDDVNSALEVSSSFELMAVIAAGHPDEKPAGKRKELAELLIREI